jgi:hypothetical protein
MIFAFVITSDHVSIDTVYRAIVVDAFVGCQYKALAQASSRIF